MTAEILGAALARRHADDVFVPECKDGATQTRSHRRLDAWAMLKTWSPVTMIGYEIKVSRSDWRRDEKLQDYFTLCHLLYVVAPKGVIPPDEIPAGVGLLELSGVGDGARLMTKRKPSRRSIDVPVNLLVYVLMSRARITSDAEEQRRNQTRSIWRRDQLRDWVNGKEDRRALSYAVSQKIQDRFEDQERRLTALKQRCEGLERIKTRIAELGFDPDQPTQEWKVAEQLRRMSGAISPELLRLLTSTEHAIARTREALEAAKEPVAKEDDGEEP